MVTTPTRYAQDPAWADIEPIPQLDGGPHALAEIAYTDEYSEAMSYLRAVMAADEMSDRALDLTAHLIKLNPAHYTVWSYRGSIVRALGKDLHDEIEWVNTLALEFQKNYQIWGYRQIIMETLRDPTGEQAFLARMLDRDAKNYHVWTYRQWLVRTFGLWPSTGSDMGKAEIDAVDGLIERDVRNNSAWNHRWYLLFSNRPSTVDGSEAGTAAGCAWDDVALIDHEIEYAADKIRRVRQNESSWNYLRGIINNTYKAGRLVRYIALVRELALPESSPSLSSTSSPSSIPSVDVLATTKSTYAIDILAELLVLNNQPALALDCLDLLATSLDRIRAPYWQMRRNDIWNSSPEGERLKRDWLDRQARFQSRQADAETAAEPAKAAVAASN